ncbi:MULTISPECIES: hypothetical protein [Bacillota]|jgi:hypothetical protein|uniref:Replication terminator protein n=1 Tax=[Eubacterium] hominis TaxID=2764325 RepID=A0A7G9GLS2_9FIRM|nr:MULTISPECIES: hypothetical protein [Bacillota]QNM11754.1 hypothetical protein H9Q80_16125 [[Eubacterium] hominis]RGB56028.1 hypothetical protein DW271_07400 [Absiella sp. AM22-9]RGB61789.1 hypothetical protein DW120_05445 [Absiella sp. AM10-20]RGB70390.1 hypothetical protein DW113_01270 [Absiella sp. AM09-45]RGB78678.1 hypothetical protein DW114_02545 [Absiella sp. AM09-50]
MRKVKKNILEMNDGEIFEKAEYEHNKIMANINDPSTDDKPRELIVKIKYVPNRAQKKVDIIPFVSSKLGKIVPIGKTMSITQMILQDTGEKVDVLQEITGEADGQINIMGDITEPEVVLYGMDADRVLAKLNDK